MCTPAGAHASAGRQKGRGTRMPAQAHPPGALRRVAAAAAGRLVWAGGHGGVAAPPRHALRLVRQQHLRGGWAVGWVRAGGRARGWEMVGACWNPTACMQGRPWLTPRPTGPHWWPKPAHMNPTVPKDSPLPPHRHGHGQGVGDGVTQGLVHRGAVDEGIACGDRGGGEPDVVPTSAAAGCQGFRMESACCIEERVLNHVCQRCRRAAAAPLIITHPGAAGGRPRAARWCGT